MPALIPDLWPDVKLDTLAPKVILDQQVEYIRTKYQGYLDAEMTTVTGAEDFVIHRLDLVAVQLDGMRIRIFTATHRKEYYPMQIEADCYQPKVDRKVRSTTDRLMGSTTTEVISEKSLSWPPITDWRPIAWDQTTFIAKVGEVLKSGEVRSVMESIIARSNEKQLLADPSAA